MKVVFLSNYINHHQIPFSEEMYKLTNGQYTFIQTCEMDRERKNMGWSIDEMPKYVLEATVSNESFVLKKIDEADVVIIGSAPDYYIKKRLKEKKLVFRYSERILKDSCPLYKWPIRFIRLQIKNPIFSPIYMLCASAYTAQDFAKFGLFINKTYKWGYFPEKVSYESIENLISNKESGTILWAARMIEWKHPEQCIVLARELKKRGYNFKINIIGDGPLYSMLNDEIIKFGLEENVILLGAKSPSEVRKYMEKSFVFISTSDRREGWGAVVNEAMNSACVVIANDEIGSAPFLIEHGKNGLLYHNGNIDDLLVKVVDVIEKRIDVELMAKNAYRTICDKWNAEDAAENLVELIDGLINEKKVKIEEGPCSKAKIFVGGRC